MLIHKQCMEELRSVLLVDYPFSCNNSTETDKLIIDNALLLDDSLDPDELIKFADILTKHTKYGNGILRLSLINKLNRIFAVDGLGRPEEFNYKYYADNLSYGYNIEDDIYNIHINAVRNLYVKFEKKYLTPDVISDAIINFYEGIEDDELTIEYGKFIKDSMFRFLP